MSEAYPDFARHHIFLSPDGLPPNLERDRKHWQLTSYSVIHNAIQEILETGVTDPDASALLQIYATTLRRNVMPDTSIERQARRIYLEHREALDRLLANKPNWIEEAKQWLKEAVAQHREWKLDLVLQSHIHSDGTFGLSISLASTTADARTEAKFDGLQVLPALKSVICDCSISTTVADWKKGRIGAVVW